MKYYNLTEEDFTSFFSLMENSFPAAERRSKEDALRLFTCVKCYNVIGYKDEKGVAAFLAYWHFEECYFVDHLAVDPRLRGNGIGSDLMKYFLEQINGTVVLEVEPPEDDITRKRIRFYERLGFHLNHFPYLQPSMQEGQPPVPLLIMSYPDPVSENGFKNMRDRIFHNCYKVNT